MNKFIEILLGLVLVIGPILIAVYSLGWGAWNFGTATWEFIKGGAIVLVVLIGLLFIMLGISDLKG
jgi:membrane protein YdbS with pleckstrin-like domain